MHSFFQPTHASAWGPHMGNFVKYYFINESACGAAYNNFSFISNHMVFFYPIHFFLSSFHYQLLQTFNFYFLSLTQHHCRKCGGVVCGNCSTKKFLLPAQSSKPLRVCDNCYNVLSSGKIQSDQESRKRSTLNLAYFFHSNTHVVAPRKHVIQ